ncbi:MULTISPECIES: fumarylacetoacetate hydrolase family protein [unclassified Schaalia]|uniref:fumarylacetoacetate hydrolase family protein n=1 Tax=unclassified Schaalia TaxID=2691889 RepID=UPI001E30F9F6|nr:MULTISPECIES: fumarylacetoacetate hydrolase family protein [unclassified Schaalia]MCD4549280.1 fumarylacetoacetate hydrolase family protein [Schaalia sp. lx-260]MCD4557089.1 fumarylacetoacetate hydrolase family protein [Schaalia sp. lx-100]
MRIVRFSDGSSPAYGVLEDGSTRIVVLKGDPLFSPIEPSGRIVELDDVRLLSPVIPRSKVIGIGNNFGPDIRQPGSPEPTPMPPIFLKPNSSVIGPDDPIVLPSWTNDVIYEGEVAVIIKSLAKDVPLEDVDSVIFGYTLANDVTARDAMDGGPWDKGKGADTFCPLGPWITVDPTLDVQSLTLHGTINGEKETSGSTAYMLHTVRELIAYCSTLFTLLPGDVIVTGCPSVYGTITAGDTVSFGVEELGTLTNPVIRR